MRISSLIFVCAVVMMVSLDFASAQTKPASPPRTDDGSIVNDQSATQENSLAKISTEAEFLSIARTFLPNTPYSLPHAMFTIDRKENVIYFVNSQRFRFHKDFLLGTYLVPRGSDVFKPIYIDEDRRFIVGTIAWQRTVEKYTWEIWEGDMATAEHLKLADEIINSSFFTKVYYKPNSSRQEDVSLKLKLDRVLISEINAGQEYLALNPGKAVGRVHIIDKLDDTVEIGSNEIIVLNELPISLPPVRGIIVTKPSSPLSHVNVLAKGWGIPNVYIKDADKLFRDKHSFVWELDASMTEYKWRQIEDVNELAVKFASPDQQIAPSDLSVTKLMGLRKMRAKDSVLFGAKAANLGEVINANIPGHTVPDGFSIPFYWYDKFMKDNGFDDEIEDLMDNYDFVHNPRFRRQKLEEFRKKIQAAKIDPVLERQIFAKWRTQLGLRPVFVRSSSNAEDLPNFSGAGLYSSAFNVRTRAALMNGVKKVWASLWNFEAYEARVRNYVDQGKVYMSALIQVGVDMQRGGVMITKDPFDRERTDTIFISSVCGHNSNVVNNKGIPEQLIYRLDSDVVSVITLSDQTSALRFSASGNMRQIVDKCANPQGRVITDAQVRTLSKIAMRIEKTFGGVPQDLEWGMIGQRIYVVQTRPYIDGK